ncbi:iron chelate uptake ABC transporter family permease subunit [Aquihabitans sp. G128]|uniref:FecCD family ABC transporter permease n=1 Tax=Aquihabitans sp. G128 TaxID=2849779 RepID=UPI001C23267A|nr:iron chelate uptake ABC transporter family permease subunit [Aquihabitans sp. G128]QXC63332.1 iron chelate uptake ABC transporter family permease subunit [Aquihabitans sp. G128]
MFRPVVHPSRAGGLVIRIPIVGWSTRVQLRAVAVSLVALALMFAVFAWSLAVGDFPVSIRNVLLSLVGQGDADARFIVRTLRLPRGLTAILVGASFGLSGAIFQRIARNPLASPDIIGVNAGAAASAVFVIVILKGSALQTTIGALLGALVTGVAVYLLAYKRGVTGYRLVLVGIGVTSILESVVSYLLTRARIFDAQKATVWLTGSLNGRGWEHVHPVSLALLVLLPASLFLARHLKVLELGDDTAAGLGARVELTRGALLMVGVALAAVATASAGPVGFVALVAPQIARRLVRARTVALIPSAAIGALLLEASDLVGRRIVAPTELPVGVITAIVGAPYLLYLLARANRIGSGG